MPVGTQRWLLLLVLSTVLGCNVSSPFASHEPSPQPALDVPTRTISAPRHERMCCAFGMDLRAQLDGMDVPLFEMGNVIDPSALDAHVYDFTEETPRSETNGLVYTCRGGWIDSAHVRDTADVTFFLASRLAPDLERGLTLVLPGVGADSAIVVTAIPHGDVVSRGRARLASDIARWIAFRIAVWHEVSTWYGAQIASAFSERLSAFSVEDLYSDALGARIGAAASEDATVTDVEGYERFVRARIASELVDLGAQPLGVSREVMSALDHRWWDSDRRVPDFHLVLRRAFPPEGVDVSPWLVADAFAPESLPALLPPVCAHAAPRPERVPDRVGSADVRTYASIRWRPGSWADDALPFPETTVHVIHESDLDALVARARTDMRAALGPDFDRPRGLE